jgi:pimeloyl-ACP methyl ester carboxylesterase
MLCETDFSPKVQGLKTPFLTVFGEHSPEHEESILRDTFLKWYPNLQVETCKNAGHFLLHEAPVHLASLITRFLS